MGTLPVMETVILLCLLTMAPLVRPEPVRGCADSKGNYFMGDTSNPCVYYWCEDGVFLPWVFPCSYGASVPYGYFGQIAPCIDNMRTCYGGVPKAAIVRDPDLENPVVPITNRPTKIPLDDNTPTLSHRPKHIEQEEEEEQNVIDVGPFDRTTPTLRITSPMDTDTKSTALAGGSTTPKTIVPTTHVDGYIYSSLLPSTEDPNILKERTSAPEVLKGRTSAPQDLKQRTASPEERTSTKNYVPTSDQRMLPFETQPPTTMNINNFQTTTISASQPTSQTTTRDTTTETTMTTTPYQPTTTTSRTSTSTSIPPRSTLPPRTTTRLSRTTGPPTTTRRMTTTTTQPIATTEDDFDFGFEKENERGGPDSLPRVIDHGGPTTVEVMERQKIFIETTRPPTTTVTTGTPTPSFPTTTPPFFTTTRRQTTTPPTETTTPVPTTTTTTPTIPTTTTTPTTTTVRFVPTSTTPTTTKSTPTTTTTTTEAPTTTLEPTSNPCIEKMPMRGGGQVITQVFPQHHIIGGEKHTNFTFQIGIIQVALDIKMASMCYLACDLHPGCAGFDWNIEDASCWFHSDVNECTSPVVPVGGAIAHYRLESCAVVSEQEVLEGQTPDDRPTPEKRVKRDPVEQQPDDSPMISASAPNPDIGAVNDPIDDKDLPNSGIQADQRIPDPTSRTPDLGAVNDPIDDKNLPNSGVQADQRIPDPTPRAPEMETPPNEWETGNGRVYNMIIDHGPRRATPGWENGFYA